MQLLKIGLAAGACALCCAPLLVPLLAGTAFVGAGTTAAALFMSYEAAMIILAANLLGGWFYWRQRNAAQRSKASLACGCSSKSGCNAAPAGQIAL